MKPTKMRKKVRRKLARGDELFPQIQRWSVRESESDAVEAKPSSSGTPVQFSPKNETGPGKKSLG